MKRQMTRLLILIQGFILILGIKEQGLINYVLFDRFDEPIFGLIQLKDKRYVFILDDLSLLVKK